MLSLSMRLRATLALVVTLAASGSCAPAMKLSAPVATSAGVRFMLERPDARSVALAGSFNQWSATSHLLSRDARGVWTLMVVLPPGEHLFMYVVNGSEWITPPLAEDYVDDGFGARNGIVVVRPADR